MQRRLMSILPEEIVLNILSRLPVKSLLRFKCICKPWSDLIRSNEFVQMHLNHANENNNFDLMVKNGFEIRSLDCSDSSSLITYDGASPLRYPIQSPDNRLLTLVGSCNGLVCIYVGDPRFSMIWIWNPCTKEDKDPPSPIEHQPRTIGAKLVFFPLTYGFGYDSNTGDYKVVWFVDSIHRDGAYFSRVEVYSLHSDSWKRLEEIPYGLSNRLLPGAGVFVNGALHWTTTHHTIEFEASTVILSFDISDERFQEVPVPNLLGDECKKNMSALGGCLCLLEVDPILAGVEIWVMKEYGVKESWTKLFTIPQHLDIRFSLYSRPIHSFKNGEILFEKDMGTFIMYHQTHKTVSVLNIPRSHASVGISTFGALTYSSSLVSPNSVTLEEQEQGDQ